MPLLPNTYYKDDEKWLLKILEQFPSEWIEIICSRYSAIYLKVFNEVEPHTKKNNKARFISNRWLRKQLKIYNEKKFNREA